MFVVPVADPVVRNQRSTREIPLVMLVKSLVAVTPAPTLSAPAAASIRADPAEFVHVPALKPSTSELKCRSRTVAMVVSGMEVGQYLLCNAPGEPMGITQQAGHQTPFRSSNAAYVSVARLVHAVP